MVRASACHAEGREFESRPSRQIKAPPPRGLRGFAFAGFTTAKNPSVGGGRPGSGKVSVLNFRSTVPAVFPLSPFNVLVGRVNQDKPLRSNFVVLQSIARDPRFCPARREALLSFRLHVPRQSERRPAVRAGVPSFHVLIELLDQSIQLGLGFEGLASIEGRFDLFLHRLGDA